MQQMNDGDSDGSEISSVWSDEDQGSDSSFEAPQHKQKKMFVPLALSVCKSTPASSKSVKGRDGTVWRVCQPGEQSAEQHFLKVQPDLMGPTAHAKDNIKDAASAFLCLLDMKILEHIRDCTVAEAHSVEEDKSWDLSIAELKAFIALLYARGVYGKNMDFESFWSQEWGLPFFRSTIPRDRFREIMRYLRFEKKQDQHTQQFNDKFAPMSFVWDRFVNNSIACYQPGSCITVDKQPPGTSVRPGCTQKDKQKTNDIKFMIAADTETKYFLNGIPYLGSDKDLGEGVVMNLVEPFLGKGRNVTIKKCFTSLSLAKKLQQKNTSLVGVINQLKPELPSSVRQRAKLYSTKVLKHDQATLTVYQSRKRESVVLLSTMHPTVSLCSDRQRTPETVIFHDDTKAGVDALDQMAHLYSVKNLTPRRLTAVFYNLLDIAGVNAYILLKACTSTPIPRRAFSLQLAKELRQELMSTKTSVQMINLELAQEPGIKKHCQVNSHCRKNTTVVSCTGCQRPMCGKCTIKVEHLCHMCALLL
ncbi:uncharacterized protein LOC141786531 [Halichoeres trimaculatus]|uniref:uncharacterized protein LOC141786531 n=1 Tax=Halichoeres trimaculatus TaxID=147232 RepID=UPI003D9F81CB